VEREAVQLPRHIARREESSDEVLRAVGRAGVADHPAGDVVDNGGETALEIAELVLDDHIEAE
jgi:hypothetical protein